MHQGRPAAFITPATPHIDEPTAPRRRRKTSYISQPDPHQAKRAFLEQLGFGIALFIVFYGILLLLKSSLDSPPAFVLKFTDREWTPIVVVFLTAMSLSFLLSKAIAMRHHGRALSETFIPNDARFDTPEQIERVLDSVSAKNRQLKSKILGDRICRGLEHFLVSKDIKEVGDIFREESEADQNRAEVSYVVVRAVLWAIPILGFVGTVLGVGAAVGGFADFLAEAQEIDQIKNALSSVTTGLAVAFDTTFVALLLSLIVMMVMSAVERAEQGKLLAFEEYCEANVLRRLPAPARAQDNELMQGVVRHVVREVFPAVEERKREAKDLAKTIASAMKSEWEEAGKNWLASIEEVQKIITANNEWHRDALKKMAEEGETLRQNASGLLTGVQGLLEKEQESVRKILEQERQVITDAVGKQHNLIQQHVGALLKASGRFEQLVDVQTKMEGDLRQVVADDGIVGVLRQLRDTMGQLDPAVRKLTEDAIKVRVSLVAGQAVADGGTDNA